MIWNQGRTHGSWRALALASVFGLSLGALSVQAQAQDGSRYDAEPVDEDEWYDPTDWFDGNNVEWDDTYESWDEGADDGTYGTWNDSWYDDGPGYDAYDDGAWDGYDYDDTTSQYGWHYQWDPRSRSWQRDYGWHDDTYEDPDHYGTHYTWNPSQDRWERQYGWYNDFYSYRSENQGWQQGSSRQQGDRQGRDSGSTAWSDDRYSDGQRQQDERRQQREQTLASGERTFRGTVDSFTRKRIRGQRDSHTLVKVRLQDGSARLIDLGPRVDLQQLDLAQGDSIQVRGRQRTISGRQVLAANSVRVDGQRIPMQGERSMRSSSGMDSSSSRGSSMQDMQARRDQRGGSSGMSGQSSSGSQKVVCEGTIAGFKTIDLPGVDDDHLLVRMRMKDGTTRVVDFGPSASLGDLDLETDEYAWIRGRKRTVDGQSFVVADSVRIGGERVPVKAGEASFRGERPSSSYHDSLQGEPGTSQGSSSSN